MLSKPPSLDTKWTSFLVTSSLIGVTLVLASTSRYGAGLSYDSTVYIAVARDLMAGKGVVSSFVAQPPLYPALLGLFGVDPLRIAHIINAVILGLIVYLSGVMLYRHIGANVLAVIGVVAILVTRSLVDVSVMAWSEPLFICFVLLFLLLTDRYLVTRNVILLTLLSVVAALASLTRYAGVTLLGSGLFVILLLLRTSPKVKMLHSFLFVLVSAMPLGLWMLRNYAVSGTFFGPRWPSKFTLADAVTLTIRGLFSWLVPDRFLQYRFALTGLSLATITIFGMIIVYLVKFVSKEDRSRLQAIIPQIGPIVIFIAVYTTFLITSSITIAYDAIGIRLLSPIHVPTLILMLSFAQKLIEPVGKHFSKKSINGVLITTAFVVLLPSLELTTQNTMIRITQGAGGYNTDLWQRSETVQYLRSHTLEGNYPVYSNAPDALYILAAMNGHMSPAKTAHNSPERLNSLSSIEVSWPESHKAYLIWFDNMQRDNLFTIDELKTIVDFESCNRFSDGAICVISRRN